jgi:DNA repair exonuclease SbcCD nuclease subunit
MRFLHTADWQIGMKLLSAGGRADEVRKIRLETAMRIVDVANEHAVDFMLIAGDLFDNLVPKSGDIGVIVAALKRATMPVFVLPGNHDPAGHKGPYSSPAWSGFQASAVTTIEKNGVHAIPGGELLVTPCTAKYGADDPTAWFSGHQSAPGLIRIGMAHGSIQHGEIARTIAGNMRGHFPIAPDAATRGRLDYLALGDWHSFHMVRNGSALISYSGAPEPTGFGEPDNGTVSIVTIDAPGTLPTIQRVRVGRLSWVQQEFEVSDDASIARFNAELMALERPADTLVRAIACGLCTPSAAQQLRALEAVFCSRFFCFEMKHEYTARPEEREAWLNLVPPGELQLLIGSLLDEIENGDNMGVATRALDKLAEFAR